MTYSLIMNDLKAECQSLKRLISRKDPSLKTSKDLAEFIFPYKEPYFELSKLVQIAMTLSVGSASCERSFSRLRMIKTYRYLRNSMVFTTWQQSPWIAKELKSSIWKILFCSLPCLFRSPRIRWKSAASTASLDCVKVEAMSRSGRAANAASLQGGCAGSHLVHSLGNPSG